MSRAHRAVAALDLRAGDRLLEIGCGRGAAAAVLGADPRTAEYVGLDRSARAIDAAGSRNARAVAAGRAQFRRLALEDADPAELGRFDLVLAVDVNLFWTRPAAHELRLVGELLRPAGRFWLVWSPPSSDSVARIRERVLERLDGAGWRARVVVESTGSAPWLVLRATPTVDR